LQYYRRFQLLLRVDNHREKSIWLISADSIGTVGVVDGAASNVHVGRFKICLRCDPSAARIYMNIGFISEADSEKQLLEITRAD
jgi:hypothetical protein